MYWNLKGARPEAAKIASAPSTLRRKAAVSTKYRDLYKAKVKKAIPVTIEEQTLFELAQEEARQEELAKAVVDQLEHKMRLDEFASTKEKPKRP